MRIGIIGAGAIGLTFAAALAPVHEVVVLARRRSVADTIVRDGIIVEGEDGATAIAVRASTEADALADREALLVAVKAYATQGALEPLRGALSPSTLIASVQNGIDFVTDARRALPGARIVAGSTTQGAIARGDARVRPVNRGTTVFGRSDPTPPTSDDLAAAFRAAGLEASVSDDIERVLWRKLVINAAINPLGALTGAVNGVVVDDPDLRDLARRLAEEAASVATAEGFAVADWWDTVTTAARATASNRNSMLQDLESGRRTEIEAISGAILRRAALHGIAAPLTEAMLRLVRARERR